nr:hypothetical protein [Tanacetum cinerariifolium]
VIRLPLSHVMSPKRIGAVFSALWAEPDSTDNASSEAPSRCLIETLRNLRVGHAAAAGEHEARLDLRGQAIESAVQTVKKLQRGRQAFRRRGVITFLPPEHEAAEWGRHWVKPAAEGRFRTRCLRRTLANPGDGASGRIARRNEAEKAR